MGWIRLTAYAKLVLGENAIEDHSTPPFAPNSIRAPCGVGKVQSPPCGTIASENRINLPSLRSCT